MYNSKHVLKPFDPKPPKQSQDESYDRDDEKNSNIVSYDDIKRIRDRIKFLYRQCLVLEGKEETILMADINENNLYGIKKTYMISKLNAIQRQYGTQTPWHCAIQAIEAKHDEELAVWKNKMFYWGLFGTSFISVCAYRIYLCHQQIEQYRTQQKKENKPVPPKKSYFKTCLYTTFDVAMSLKQIVSPGLPKKAVEMLDAVAKSGEKDATGTLRDLLIIIGGFAAVSIPYNMFIQKRDNELRYQHRITEAKRIYEIQTESTKQMAMVGMSKFLWHLNQSGDDYLTTKFKNLDITDVIGLFVSDKMPKYFKTQIFSDHKEQERFMDVIDDLMQHEVMNGTARKALMQHVVESSIKQADDIKAEQYNELLQINSNDYSQ